MPPSKTDRRAPDELAVVPDPSDRFDRVIVVDWSAASRPVTGADSIWIAHAQPSRTIQVENLATRAAAVERWTTLCQSGRVLLGVDASLGAPHGLAAALAESGDGRPGWEIVWDVVTAEVHDSSDNSNDRFEAAARLNARVGAPEGPFWGLPRGRLVDHVRPTRPPMPVTVDGTKLAEYRVVEQQLRADGRRPQSTWKLAYQASVGGQFLTALGRIRELAAHLPGQVAVWPFEDQRDARVVVAEVWPGMFDWTSGQGPRDRDQVVGVLHELLEWHRSGRLAAALGVREQLPEVARREEGWVLGVAPRAS